MQLEAHDLTIGYASRPAPKVVASGLTLSLQPGKLTALLGSNGSGKSTLIRTLAGLQPALGGRVMLGEQDITTQSPPTLAKQIAVVLQESARHLNLTVFEVAAMGRTPYTNWLGKLTALDKKLTYESLERAGIAHLAERRIAQLSDGEWQKTMFSKALAQDTPLILLDEPTAHLDLLSKIELVGLLRTAAYEHRRSVLFSTHDLDLALKMADSIWLMDGEGSVYPGAPEDLVLEGKIEKIYSNGLQTGFSAETGNIEVPAPNLNRKVAVNGQGTRLFWTKKALKRAGYTVCTEGKETSLAVVVHDDHWLIHNGQNQHQVKSIKQLLNEM